MATVKKPQGTPGQSRAREDQQRERSVVPEVTEPSPWFESCQCRKKRLFHQRNGDADNGFPGNHPRPLEPRCGPRARNGAETRTMQRRPSGMENGLKKGKMKPQAKPGGRGIPLPYFGSGQSSTKRARSRRKAPPDEV